MKNGVHKRRYQGDKKPAWYWRYEDAVSADFSSESAAQRSYIEKLMDTPYAELLVGKPYDRQHAIVFGAPA